MSNSNEVLFQSAVDSNQAVQATREPKQGRVRALLGDGNGNLVGPSGVPWVLARLFGDASRRVEAYNGTPITPAENMSVTLIIRYAEGRATHYEVERLSNDVAYPGYNPGQQGGIGSHALSHEFRAGGGWDGVNVYERAITSLRVNAQATPNLTVQVAPGYYVINGQEYYFAGGNSPAFTPPLVGAAYHVLSIDASGSLIITPNGLTAPGVLFTLPANTIALGAVYLTVAQATILEGDIWDVRPFLSMGGSGGGTTGSGGSHIHALNRWVASAVQTNFLLPDVAVELETVSDNGVVADPLGYALSADGTQLVFTTGITAGHVVVSEYIVATGG